MPRLFTLLPLVGALAACGQPHAVAMTDGWVRLAAVPGRPAAAYFTLQGAATDTTLIAVATPIAAKSEIHESKAAANGATTMAELRQVAVPAGATVTFAPGGKHVMLFGVRPGVKPGQTVPLTLTFADGRKLAFAAKAIAAGDPAPQP